MTAGVVVVVAVKALGTQPLKCQTNWPAVVPTTPVPMTAGAVVVVAVKALATQPLKCQTNWPAVVQMMPVLMTVVAAAVVAVVGADGLLIWPDGPGCFPRPGVSARSASSCVKC
jgi:hypothetical protein